MTSKPVQIKDAAAKKALSLAFQNAGWKIQFVTTEGVAENANCIYVCDDETGFIVVTSVTKGSLESLREQAKLAPFGFDDICNALGTLLGELAAGKQALDKTARESLGAAATLYMLGTRTYAIAVEKGQADCQFLILRHADASAGEHVLRPVALPANKRFAPKEIEGVVQRVLAMDRQQHPERFPRAKVVPFKARVIQRID